MQQYSASLTAGTAAGNRWNADSLNLLQKLPLFAGLSPASLQDLLAEAETRVVARRTQLFQQGQKATRFYVLYDGWVKLHRELADGQESVIAVFARGESFAEAAIFEEACYPVSATMVTDGKVLEIPGRSFLQRIQEDPDLALNMLAAMSRRLRLLVRQVEQLSCRSSVERLAEFLLRLCPEEDGPACVQLPLDKYLIAARLGMQPETFSRSLARLREAGVSTQGSEVLIDDIAALRRIAQR